MSSRTFDLVSRGGWGARAPKFAVATTAVETFLHHSVGYGQGGASYMRQMQDQHMAPGWAGLPDGGSDIAYNFVIDFATLVVYEGRGWGVRPAAQRNYNAGTWALCVMGDFRSLFPSQGLLDTIAALARHGHQLGFLPLTLTGGHRAAPGQSTSCPGDNLATAIPTIRSRLTLEDEMWTRELNEAEWRALARAGIAAGTEDAVADYWWTNRAARTDTEHREASRNMSATIAVRVATGVAGPPGPPGPPGKDGKPVTLTITGDAQLP